jgi:hypothetical protein
MKTQRTPFHRSSLPTICRQFPATRACSQREREGVRESHSNKEVVRCHAKTRIKLRCQPLCSQPISVHGAGTVRPWAAVDLTIARGRHNVSARDGGLPAARRTGAGAFLCAPLRPLPRMHLLHSCRCIHSTSHTHRPADAVVPVAGDPPLIHGPAAATGPASFYITATSPQKVKFAKQTHLEEFRNICKRMRNVKHSVILTQENEPIFLLDDGLAGKKVEIAKRTQFIAQSISNQ